MGYGYYMSNNHFGVHRRLPLSREKGVKNFAITLHYNKKISQFIHINTSCHPQ